MRREMRKGVLLAAIVLAVPAIAQQTTWVKFSEGDGTTHYLDTSRIQKDSYGTKTYRAWWRSTYAQPQKSNYGTYVESLTLFRVDCNSASLTQIQSTARDQKQQPVWNMGGGQESIALPDSIGETFMHLVCNTRPM